MKKMKTAFVTFGYVNLRINKITRIGSIVEKKSKIEKNSQESHLQCFRELYISYATPLSIATVNGSTNVDIEKLYYIAHFWLIFIMIN